MRILVVDDEKKIANFIERGLKENHYVVDVARDSENALMTAEINPYDLIILDIMLPGKDGVTVCKELRKNKVSTPVLMLTARDSTRDKVRGLDAGADDYLTKPFAFDELLARVRALLRRETKEKNTILKVGDLELNQLTREVKRQGKPIILTSKEYALLEYFMLNPNQIITRTMISEHVWEESFDSFTNVIDVYVKHLRDKVDKGFSTQLLQTVRGAGYILKEP
jgi:two-component system, OmpR family, copper resistance phosphate regulon response regulator CusR